MNVVTIWMTRLEILQSHLATRFLQMNASIIWMTYSYECCNHMNDTSRNSTKSTCRSISSNECVVHMNDAFIWMLPFNELSLSSYIQMLSFIWLTKFIWMRHSYEWRHMRIEYREMRKYESLYDFIWKPEACPSRNSRVIQTFWITSEWRDMRNWMASWLSRISRYARLRLSPLPSKVNLLLSLLYKIIVC